jgi:twinkle protein
MSEATFVRHAPCEKCGSKDNNTIYSDGGEHCFGCGEHRHGTGDSAVTVSRRKTLGLIEGESVTLLSRGITKETCEHFGYQKGKYKNHGVQIAPYYDADGQLVAQKLRKPDKTFLWLGDQSKALPFGAHAFQKSGKMLTVCEGEIDALTMSQVQGNKWPVVSISCGAGPQIRKYIAQHRDYFMGFERVNFMFDMDAPGREAATIAASIIGRRAHICDLPLKDANDMLKAGKVSELIDAMWKAAPYRPEGIVDMETLKDRVKQPPEMGLSYPWESLTKLFYGIRIGQLVGLGAGVGSGKTDFFTQTIMHLATEHKQSCGVFYLETPIDEVARRIAGKLAGKTFHVPDAGWTVADIDTAWASLMKGGKVWLYDNFGNNEWEPIKEKIEYLHHAEGVQYFFIDHLTALAAWQDDEKHALEVITSEMGALVKALPITIFFVSHLTTPEGKSHEEGGRVMSKHFKGSRSIQQWSTDMIGLERNQQSEDRTEQQTTTVRILKERTTGRGTGQIFFLGYDPDTGLLYEKNASEPGATSGDEFTNTNEDSNGSSF